MLDYHAVKNWDFGDIVQTYTERDTMLYALGIGIGADAMDQGQLRFVYEKDLQAVPTMAVVLGSPGYWWNRPWTGADWVKLVQGEQRVQLFKPLPNAGTIVARNRVESITDKGAGKGAIAVTRRDIFDQASGELLAINRNLSFLRGDGGYSERAGLSDPGLNPLPPVPERTPEIEVELPSLEQAALIYRLTGDYNPLHADPEVAKSAGFPRPILQGLCTYGMALHAVLRRCCAYDATRIRNVAARFTASVFPGETIRVQIWRESATLVRFRAQAQARDIVVLNNGTVELA